MLKRFRLYWILKRYLNNYFLKKNIKKVKKLENSFIEGITISSSILEGSSKYNKGVTEFNPLESYNEVITYDFINNKRDIFEFKTNLRD